MAEKCIFSNRQKDADILDQSKIKELQELSLKIEQDDSGPSMFQEILSSFLEQAPLSLERIKEFSEAQDTPALLRESHKFKGMCLNIGATGLARLCREIEQSGQDTHHMQILELDRVLVRHGIF